VTPTPTAPRTKPAPAPAPAQNKPNRPDRAAAEQGGPGSRVDTVAKPHQSGQVNPPRSGAQPAPTQPRPADKGVPPGQASHNYYPKGYHQSAETHTLPPLYPNSSVPYAPPANSPPGQSKKNDRNDKN